VIAPAGPYSLLKRLTVAFSIVALLVFALVSGFLYDSLGRELQRRDDMEIAEKLDQFLQQAHDLGSTQSLLRNSAEFHEDLKSHPAVHLAILNGRGDILVQRSNKPSHELKSVGSGYPYQHAAYSCHSHFARACSNGAAIDTQKLSGRCLACDSRGGNSDGHLGLCGSQAWSFPCENDWPSDGHH